MKAGKKVMPFVLIIIIPVTSITVKDLQHRKSSTT
jgi:hypothetical protein